MLREMNKTRILFLFVCCAAGLAALWYWRHASARMAEDEIIALSRQIELGMPEQQVHKLAAEGAFRKLALQRISEDLLLVRTPLQWGAVNWVMWVDLHEGRVRGVRVRLQDDEQVRPVGAPPDKGWAGNRAVR